MSEPVARGLDIGVALGLIVICALLLFESRALPPGSFEPLGSAPVPRATAVLIIVLCSMVIARAALRPQALATERGSSTGRGLGGAAVTVILTLLYVTLVHFRVASFAILTSGYLIATIGWLVGFERRRLPAVIATALIVGFSIQYVFTRVFVVDLPGL